ncbi:unnamed protein product [Linum tenue]|uniref:Uncharacterized protein n=1 Tax=Linum tenue TaxID=586396 RepID=A0AAV0H277_9ROSI|nr:unnamed protein product [Linum tenue]
MLSPYSNMRHVSALIIHSFILPLSVPGSLPVPNLKLSQLLFSFSPPALLTSSQSDTAAVGRKEEIILQTDEEEIVRAPSLAEEFKRLEGEKAKEERHIEVAEQQGLASQTADKTLDAIDESVGGADDPDRLKEAVKNRYKEHEPHADYRRRGDNTTRF